MKKILLSLGSIVFAGAILAGGTGAFLSDSGTSTGNTFASGVVDLKVDNESYFTDAWGKLAFSSSTSWSLSNLAGKLFFNFNDVKPGDIGEDTISLHVNNNNAWACMNINMTGTPENGQNEPEALVDPTIGTNDGELQNYLNFTFWADDGDNVYEKGEKIFKQGLSKDIFNGSQWALADSAANIWDGSGPIPGDTTKYIGKAWCFGDLVPNPVNQDNKGKTGTNGPLVRGTGFSCNGASIGNIVQSDGIKADVSFSVEQSRNNGAFLCGGDNHIPPPTSTSTLFSETFNGCQSGSDFDNNHAPNWGHHGHVKGNGDNSSHGNFADLNAGDSDHMQNIVTNGFSTVGYHNITLKFDRKTDDTNAPPQPVGSQILTVEYSVNGGLGWTTLETVSGETPWTTQTFSLSPSADNKTNVMLRFTLNGQDGTNHAYLDNIIVTGVSP